MKAKYPWVYRPGFMDLTNPTVIRGHAISRDVHVRVAKELNPPMFPSCFRMIEDQSGNVQSVWRQALVRPK